jgi:hypothetical protein
VLLIQGTRGPSNGLDVTAFVDQIEIVQVSNGAVVSGAVANFGFETFDPLSNGNYGYAPTGASWTFNNRSGIAQNGSNFSAPTAPQGSAVAFVQSDAATNGLLQQTLTLGTGTYFVRFQVAQRICCSTSDQGLNVYVAGTLVGTVQPTNTGGFVSYSSGNFTVDAPAVSSFTPTRNFLAAAVATNVVVNFTQNIDNATASNIKVFSAQAGGRKASAYSTSGGAVTVNPTTDFKPGETVFTTIPATVASTGGAAITNKQVYQFTTAAGGTGRGNFLPGSTIAAGGGGYEAIAADFNGDGILDLADTGGGLTVRLGTGGGSYGAATAYAAAGGGFSLTAGDLDNDGDIDLVAPRSAGPISIMQNNGSGVFTALTSAATSGNDPRKAALGDIDGDGDLDLVVPISAGGGAVGVYFNNGSGSFSAPTTYGGSANSTYVVLGDVDKDGDLDYAVADYNNARVVVRLNNGSGVFSGGSNVTVGANPGALALADVNGDGALDILTPNEGVASISVSLNGNTGTGSFGTSSAYTLPASSSGLAVGDVDADGDLDVVAGSRGGTGFYLLLNGGSGIFGTASSIAATNAMFYLTLADLDNDGDLDLAGAANNGSALFVRLNQQLAPTITSISPNPAGAGIPATLTGTNLSGATSLTINGAATTILTNTGTAITFRVPAGATASGVGSVTTPGGTATLAFTFLPTPGNALAFDGTDDYVALPNTTPVPTGNAAYTLEAWIKPTSMGAYGILGWGNWTTTNQANALRLSSTGLINYWWNNDLILSTPDLSGRWHHVAATFDGTTRTLYLDGVALGSDTPTGHAAPTPSNLRIGSTNNGEYFPGSIDEVRLWSVARTPAQLLAGMKAPVATNAAGLLAYYNLDEGTPGGTNTGLTMLYDLTGTSHGTLTNFALTGTTSNWVESYAMVVPTATAATSVGSTGFTANWTAPATGTIDNGYRVDVSTANTFASVISGSPFTAGSAATSLAITDLTATTTYYYRVRADKTSVTGQGAYSNTITVATCAAPVATAQNLTLTLNASGSATAAATAVNNSSTANCGPAPAGSLSVSPSAFGCTDAVTTPATNAALSFNGSTQYVEGTNASLPLGNAARTIEAWVYPTAAGQNGAIFNYGTPTPNQRSGILLISGRLYYVGENNDLSGGTTLSVNTWSHVAATYDGSTLKLYVNGVLDAQSNPGAFSTTGTVWRIAQRSSPQTGEFLTGRVDEVRVWSVARTAAQVKAAMSASLPGGSTGLVASYRLNENSGSTTADASASNSPGTLYNNPTWTTGAPVTPGLPVTLTVTDNSGNTSTATAIVTVRDNAAPAAPGSGPLPAAPTLATSNVPEAGNYGVLYQLDIANAASFNGLSSIPYAVNNSGASIARPARVAYFMELQSGGVTKWVWASMDNFASTLTQLGLPNPTANNVAWNQSVSNLNVFASSNAGVTTGTSLGTGRLEMWTSNYETTNASNVPGASSSVFDFGDQPTAGNYGSFQVHNVTAGQTLLAYNNWGSNGDGGGIGDLGIGNQVGGSGNPDWTFAFNANTYTVKRLYILVPNNGAFTQPATVALSAAGTATVAQSAVYTGAADNCGVNSVVVSPTTFTCAQVGTPQLVTVAVSDASGNTTTQSAFVTVTVPPTTTTTWNGSASTVWTDCANWSYGKVPDATTSGVIPTGQPRYPVLTTGGTYPVLNLTVDASALLTLNSGATLQVNGNFANSGTATLSGTVAFVGSAATQTLSNGSGFTTVTVNKPSGTVQLGQNLTINSALTLSSGTLTTTGSYQVNLGGSASLSESETSYVLGKVVVNRTLVPGTAQSFSGLGLTLTPATGSTAPGATVLTRTTGTAITGAGTSQSILRYFDIQPATNTGLNVTMNFTYFNHELNGIAVGNLALFKSVSGGTPWIPQRGTTAGANLITKTGITDFSVWTLGNSANPLPVELVAFTATALSHNVQLKWSTASEKNTARFEVERSLDATSFDRIGSVPAAGNSSTLRAYDLLDNQVPKTLSPQPKVGVSQVPLYYRLKQVDLDGTFSYSPVRSVRLSEAADGLALFPNPTTARTTLSGTQPGSLVQVFDALGRVVAAATADAAGTATLALPAGLATGIYVVRTGTQALRLTVE